MKMFQCSNPRRPQPLPSPRKRRRSPVFSLLGGRLPHSLKRMRCRPPGSSPNEEMSPLYPRKRTNHPTEGGSLHLPSPRRKTRHPPYWSRRRVKTFHHCRRKRISLKFFLPLAPKLWPLSHLPCPLLEGVHHLPLHQASPLPPVP